MTCGDVLRSSGASRWSKSSWRPSGRQIAARDGPRACPAWPRPIWRRDPSLRARAICRRREGRAAPTRTLDRRHAADAASRSCRSRWSAC